MSDDDKHEADNDEKEASSEGSEGSEKFELSEEGQEQVRQMRAAYDDDRGTAVLPGSGGTITGVAINEWLDDDGNPKFGKEEQKEREEKAEHEDTDEQQEKDNEKEKQQQSAD
jgi:hypothetical protein